MICDEYGNLYYTNDSGYLFKLQGQPSWKVSFDTRGGSSLAALYVVKGSAVIQPNDPTREGHEFAGWFIDEACSQAWSFSTPVTSDTVLYAKWNEIVQVVPGEDGGAAGGEGSAAGGGSGNAGDNGDAGSVGNGSTAGVGSVPNGTVAPANLPVSLGESVAEAIAEAEALEKAGADTAEAVALSARAAGLAVEDGSDAPAWAYVVFGTGVVAALGAAVWFVAARRRVV